MLYRHVRLKLIALTGACLLLAAAGLSPVWAAPVPGGTLDPTTVPKYVTPLVIPPVMPAGTGALAPAANYDIAVRQFKQQILPGGIWNNVDPLNPRTDPYGPTTVWSYGRAEDPLPDSSGIAGGAAGVAPAPNSSFNYPAFTVENTSGVATTVRWINDLVDKDPASPTFGNFLPHLFAVDQTVHWANPAGTGCAMGVPNRTDCETMNPAPYTGPVPLVTHLHGAHVGPDSDGYPESWWLPAANNITGYVATGSKYTQANPANAVPGSAYYSYPNTQPAATLWYHDHALGMTRNNVYAGPAGFWLVRGGANDLVAGLPGPAPGPNQDVNNLTPGSVRNQIREIPLAIQDRSFNYDPATGATSLFYPDTRAFFDNFTGPYIGDMAAPSDMPPIWNPEVFFNTIVVNGTTWPKFDVAPARYRLRLLNGCNSRTLNLSMFVVTGPGLDNINGTADDVLGTEIPFFQIGAEQGFLSQVAMIRTGFSTPIPRGGPIPAEIPLPPNQSAQALLLMPAERADVIVDFSAFVVAGPPVTGDGTRIRIINTAPDAPFGGFPDVAADPATTGQVMDFVVNAQPLPTDATTTPPENLLLPAEGNLGAASNTRQLSLNELGSDQVCVEVNAITGIVGTLFTRPPGDPTFLADCLAFTPIVDPVNNTAEPMGPREAHLGTVVNGVAVPLQYGDPITEFPLLNSTEIWEFYNTTMDAHPIHLHLVRFQLINRQDIDPALTPIANTVTQPLPNELGYKDTVVALPGQVTRIKARFDIAGLYVWHCHIVEHEDNDMMRPFMVIPAAAATGVTLAPAAATPSPQPAGTLITFTATPTGGDPTGPYQYRFFWRPSTSTTWTASTTYAANASWDWNTAGLAAGTYYVLAQTRHIGSAAPFEAQKLVSFKLVSPTPATGVTLAPAAATPSPQPAGTLITFTATPTGGDPTGPYQYRFFWRPSTSTTWTASTTYAANASWDWNTTGLAAGTYYVLAQTRHIGSAVPFEAQKLVSFKLVSPTPATGVTLAPAAATPSPQPSGTLITFTATPTGGDPIGPYEYRFFWRPSTSTTWTASTPYAINASWDWNTTGLATGTYYVLVQTRHVGSSVAMEAQKVRGFTLN